MIIDLSKVYEFEDVDSVYYLGEYMPFSHSHSPNDFDRKVMNIKNYEEEDWKVRKQIEAINYFTNILKTIVIKDCVVCRIPRSESGSHENHICTIARNLSRAKEYITDGTHCLNRFKTIQTAHISGIHSKEDHLRSLRVINPEIVKGKDILLLDDVITFGASMSACFELLEKVGAKSIVGLGMGLSNRS